ncbi:hypothetical protein Syun_022249 [Stephania yunnanensis]|uniref:Uncharacterized protein n=1 Tax=Stephania yunnanensis TaxID=152371 RepID=A0AAP0IHH7_9MAGN
MIGVGENKRVVMTNTNNKNNSTSPDLPNSNTNSNSNSNSNNNINHDVHSMPDSPMLETSSSFGSTSSSPSMANLPPIRLHVEDHLHHPHHHKQQQQQLIGGLDESFAQMNVSTVPTTATTSVSVSVVGHKQQQQQQQQQQEEEEEDDGGAFLLLSSPPLPLPTSIGVVNSNNAFVVSDDERSDHGIPTAFRKPPSPHHMLHRSAELPSPDDTTMSRDDNNNNNNNNNVISHAKPLEYQESVPVVQRDARVLLPHVDPNRDASDPNYRIQIQQHQLHDSGHLMQSHLDQQQFQHHQQFVHAGTHYIHHTTGAVPMSSYYAMQPQQQQQQQQHHQHQLDQHHYPMYFMPLRHTQPYNLSMQSNLTDATTAIASSRPPLPPNPTILTTSAYKDQPVSSVYPSRTPTPPKPEIYRTAASAAPQLLHMTAADQHYANYSHQMHHPPQSVASAANYTYDFTDPAHSQIYYTQPIAPTLPPQYQTITSAAGIPGSEIPVQLPTVETPKQQYQIRTSQPI